MSSGGSQNTVSQQSQPPPQFTQALQQVGQQAAQVGQTPYQPYTGQQVAGLSPDQLAAINSIQGTQGITAPYINSAAQEIGASTAPLAPTIQPYVNNASGLFNGAAANDLVGIANQGSHGADQQYAASAGTAAGLPGAVQPGINAATGLYGASAQQLHPTQFSPGQVGQYESPYTNAVVNATQAEFANQNAQQQQQVEGNAISQGAFGGDRAGVAAGITAGQEQLAQAPVIAGLENQGYSQALQEFNQQQQVGLGAQQATQQLEQGAGAGILAGGAQALGARTAEGQLQQGAGAGLLQGSGQRVGAAQGQGQLGIAAGQGIAGLGGQVLGANEANAWLASQAGYGLGNLGNEALGSTLQQANAQLGIGGLEQGQAQANLNVPYQQYIASQAYPFQTTAWESGIAGQLANAAGGTASTTSPGPSPWSQVAGTGLAALGGLGVTGAFGPSGYLTGANGLFGAGAGAAGAGAAGLAAAAPYLSSFGAAGGGGAILDTVGGALLAKDGGAIPHRAGGGGIVQFPVHKTRMPGTGIVSNDNFTPHIPRLAAGGVPIPQMPTNGGGITASSVRGGNGIDIPQINVNARKPEGSPHFGGGVDLSSLAPGSVGQYLAGSMPKPQQAPPTPIGGTAVGPGITGLQPQPTPTPPPIIPGSPQDPNFIAPQSGSGGEGGSGMRRGGGIVHRAEGGYTGRITDTPLPEGYGDDVDVVPPIPPDQIPPWQGNGIVSGPPTPPTSPPAHGGAEQGQGEEKPTIGGRRPWEALLAAGLGIMGGTSPHAATNIGRGGMEGLQFAERQRALDEQMALRRLQQQDIAAYRQAVVGNQQAKTDQYGRRVDVFQQEAGIHQQNADTHAQAIQNTDAYRTRRNELMAQGLNEKAANDQAVNEIRQQNADTALYGAFNRNTSQQRTGDQRDRALDQGDQRLQQSDQRIQQAATRIANSQEAQALRRNGQANDTDINAASRLVASGVVPNLGVALKQVQAGRATQQQAAPAPAAQPAGGTPQALPPDPFGLRQ